MYDFYHTYSQPLVILQQAAANSVGANHLQRVEDFMLEILSELIPAEIKSSLPSIEEIESSLEQLAENDGE